MVARWLLIPGIVVIVLAAPASAATLAPVLIPDEYPGGPRECVGDIDGDGYTDWSDLCILMNDYGCMSDCVADLDGDGDTDLADLAILWSDWGCPEYNVDCDEPDPNIISVSVLPVDNSGVGPDDDPLAPEFDGGSTHFTFDLQIQVEEPDADWCAASVDSILTNPHVEFFLHPFDTGGVPPEPAFFSTYPALEFDSYWCGASVIPPGGAGDDSALFFMDKFRTASQLYALWSDYADTGGGTFTISRFTIAVPSDSGMIPMVVSAGTGGDMPIIGTITGWASNTSLDPGCVQIAFDIVYECECVGDVDGDCDTDWSDLAILLADYGCISDCIADLDNDDDTDLADLSLLLGDWACPDGDGSCDEPSPGVIDVSVAEVDNSSVGPGDDLFEPTFDGGVTHFTFDLQVVVEPGEDWGAAETEAQLADPNTSFFLHVWGDGEPPDPSTFALLPALEFDSYWCGASIIDPNDSGEPVGGLLDPNRSALHLSALWLDMADTGGDTFTIERFTVVVPLAGSATPPMVIPNGTGGDIPVIGTIAGWVTNASYNPGCDWFWFDIIYCGPDSDGDGFGNACDNCPDDYNPSQEDCDTDGIGNVCDCPGDVDCDNDVDLSDLAELLSNYNESSGMSYADGDLDDDGDVDLSDLAALLAVYDTICE